VDLSDEIQQGEFVVAPSALLRPEVVEDSPTGYATRPNRCSASSRMADAALLIAHKLDDRESLARALRAKANVLYAKGEHASAVELHEQAVVLFEQSSQRHELARTLSGSIQRCC